MHFRAQFPQNCEVNPVFGSTNLKLMKEIFRFAMYLFAEKVVIYHLHFSGRLKKCLICENCIWHSIIFKTFDWGEIVYKCVANCHLIIITAFLSTGIKIYMSICNKIPWSGTPQTVPSYAQATLPVLGP